MRRAFAIIAAAAVLFAACDFGGPTEDESNLTDPGSLTREGSHPDVLAEPSPGDTEHGEGATTPAERNDVSDQLRESRGPAQGEGQENADSAAAVGTVRQFADLLERRQFADARRLYAGDGSASGLGEEEFAEKFEGFETIEAEVQYPRRAEATVGSNQVEVQLTLSGNLESGTPYVRTGLVTLASGAGRWEIVHIRLGTEPGPELESEIAAQTD